MDFLKGLFEKGAITWEQFCQLAKDNNIKIGDLSSGSYVSKAKFDSEIKSANDIITDLNTQITNRDNDLTTLKSQLENVDTDNKTKVADLTKQITSLQSGYDTVKNEYEAKLNTQAYEFAAAEFANSQKFTCNAAKRDFTEQLIKQSFQVKDKKIIGADDFVKTYATENPDAFVVENPNPGVGTKPNFVAPTQQKQNPQEINAFSNTFNFLGVRPHEQK